MWPYVVQLFTCHVPCIGCCRRQMNPGAFSHKVLDLMEAGESVAELAAALGMSDQTISTWRTHDQADRWARSGGDEFTRNVTASRRGR